MYSGFHVPEGQGSALREVEWQDSSHGLEIQQSTFLENEEVVCSSGLESQYHTFSKVEGQDSHYIQELEHQLHTSLDFKACSLREEKGKQLSHCNVIGYDEPPKSKGKKKKEQKRP